MSFFQIFLLTLNVTQFSSILETQREILLGHHFTIAHSAAYSQPIAS